MWEKFHDFREVFLWNMPRVGGSFLIFDFGSAYSGGGE